MSTVGPMPEPTDNDKVLNLLNSQNALNVVNDAAPDILHSHLVEEAENETVKTRISKQDYCEYSDKLE